MKRKEKKLIAPVSDGWFICLLYKTKTRKVIFFSALCLLSSCRLLITNHTFQFCTKIRKWNAARQKKVKCEVWDSMLNKKKLFVFFLSSSQFHFVSPVCEHEAQTEKKLFCTHIFISPIKFANRHFKQKARKTGAKYKKDSTKTTTHPNVIKSNNKR